MNEEKKKDVIDLREVWKKIKERKKLFYKVLPTVFVLSCAYILCIPRTYSTSLSLAPEVGGSAASGTLGSLASSFGIDLGNMETSDAISPLLYPDLMDDNGFVVGLFSVKVKSLNGEIECSYFDYLKKRQAKPFWAMPIGWVKQLFKPKEQAVGGNTKPSPYILSRDKDGIAEKIRKDITISVDKKTGVITINATAQDALICKTLADSVKERLQVFITNYRTNKARIDEQYYKELLAEAKRDYEKARQLYGSYSDANMDVTLQSVKSKQEDMENDMQLKYNTYSTLMAQYQAAKAKVQERTPAFTLVKGAAVPVKASGPKRMIFVVGMTLLAFLVTSFICVRKELHFTF